MMRKYNVSILHVEDSATIRAVVSDILTPFVKELNHAVDGEEGIRLYEALSPDIVLTDIHMPNLDGLSMIRRIKEKNSQARVIVLTEYSKTDYLLSAIENGVDGFILKPISAEQLIRAVEKEAQGAELSKRVDKQEETIRSHQAHLRLALDAANFDLWEVNLTEKTVSMPTPLFKSLGYPPEKAPSSFDGLLELTHEDDIKSLKNILQEGEIFSKEFRLKRNDGSYAWVFTKGRRLEEDSREKLIGIIGDITERKQNEEAVKKELEYRLSNLRRAQRLQRKLNTYFLPTIKNLNIQALYMPSEDLSGDYFDIHKTKTHLVIIHADCTGHGIEAALDAAILNAITTRYMESLAISMSTDKFLSKINSEITNFFDEDRCPSMFVCVIDLESRRMSYSKAGHIMPYIVRSGKVVELENSAGMLLGFKKDASYEVKEYFLEEEDFIFFYSDALIELYDEGKLLYSKDNLKTALSSFGNYGIGYDFNFLFEDMVKHGVNLPLEDDLSVIGIQFLLPVKQSHAIVTYNELEEYRLTIEDWLTRFGYLENDILTISVSFHEMGTNAIRHGNNYDENKKVYINVDIDCERCEISLEDEGEGFKPNAVPLPTDFERLLSLLEANAEKEFSHGRGIWLTDVYMDKMKYNEKGNKVTFMKKRSPHTTKFSYLGNA